MALANALCPHLWQSNALFSFVNYRMSAKSSEDVHMDMTREVSNAEAKSSPLTERMAQVSKSAHR